MKNSKITWIEHFNILGIDNEKHAKRKADTNIKKLIGNRSFA